MSENSFIKKYGPWVLLAGAADGLGEAYSLALAKRGLNIVMVDVQKDLMNALAERIEKEFSVRTLRLHLDLKEQNASELILKAIEGVECRCLIYNAAFSRIKPFSSCTIEELDSFIGVNAYTPIKLVHGFANKLKEKNTPGGILLMSSLAGLIGMQLVAPYAATKAFTWNLAEALYHELKAFDIDIMACLSGAIATPTYLNTQPSYGSIKPKVMSAADVAESALRQLGKKNLYIPGFSNRFNYFILTRLLPRKLASKLANSTIKKMYKHKLL